MSTRKAPPVATAALTGKRRLSAAPAPEIHVFLATAIARDPAATSCAPGEPHSLLIFCRQPEGEAPDERLARMSASASGWSEIRLERSKRLPVTAQPAEAVLRAAFLEALQEGFAVVAHRRREDRSAHDSAERKKKKPRR
ncbi:MAG: hypothetical protein JO035_10845 [Betaproteobacteria bacterium]|nr:hypothetical protein [Betaproteobacteria bacterium]